MIWNSASPASGLIHATARASSSGGAVSAGHASVSRNAATGASVTGMSRAEPSDAPWKARLGTSRRALRSEGPPLAVTTAASACRDPLKDSLDSRRELSGQRRRARGERGIGLALRRGDIGQEARHVRSHLGVLIALAHDDVGDEHERI